MSGYYWASVGVNVCTSCRPLAASCTSDIDRHRISAIGHRCLEKSAQLVARRRPVAPPAFADNITIFRDEALSQPNQFVRLMYPVSCKGTNELDRFTLANTSKPRFSCFWEFASAALETQRDTAHFLTFCLNLFK